MTHVGHFVLLDYNPKTCIEVPIGLKQGQIDQWTSVPDSKGKTYLKLKLKRTLFGAFRKTALKTDPIWIIFRTTTGGQVRFRFAPDNVENGILISPLPISTDEFEHFFKNNLPRNITHFKITPENTAEFSSDFEFQFLEVSQ